MTILAANPDRLQAIIVNDSSAVLYLKFGDDAATDDYTYKVAAGITIELPMLTFPFNNISGRRETAYPGVITGVWASANGAAQVTELA